MEEINEDDMEKMFGFAGFGSSKGQNHQEDAEEAVYKQFLRKREFKQFMNKKPGVRAQPGGGEGGVGRGFGGPGMQHQFM